MTMAVHVPDATVVPAKRRLEHLYRSAPAPSIPVSEIRFWGSDSPVSVELSTDSS